MKTLNRLYRYAALIPACAWLLRGDAREAAAYLAREVPKWKPANGCYSCHNNGDGLRALLAAKRAGITVDEKALGESLQALLAPAEWEPKPLARLQFAGAVREAVSAGFLERAVLERAAEAVAGDQQPDGHWMVDEELAPGSPVTYGPVVATYLGRETLASAGGARYRERIGRANRWLAERKSGHVIDTAAQVAALRRDSDIQALVAAQAADGSWNGEPFDTALARLALGPTHPASIKARAWLMKAQWSGGGWPATTRPAGGDSYAQHISTTAWVLLSLATAPER